MKQLIPILIIVMFLFTAHFAFSQGIWKTYTTADGLAGNYVCCITQDKLNNMWFGTWGHGLSKLDTNGIWTNFLTDSNVYVLDIEIDSINNKWLALSQNSGYYKWGTYIVKFDDSSFTYYSPTGHPKTEPAPNVLGQDSLGHIWCGTTHVDNYWFDGSSWHLFIAPGVYEVWDGTNEIRTDHHGKLYFAHKRGISTETEIIFWGGTVCDIAFDKQDRMWFGVDDWQTGLWMFDGTNWYHWTHNDGLLHPFSDVVDVAVDSNDNVWISNSSYGYPNLELYGVSKFDGSSFTHFNVDDGLAAGLVFDIYADKKGDLWFATDGGGVSVFNDTTTTIVKPIMPQTNIPSFSLFQNYPNPFNMSSLIKYQLKIKSKVVLSIFNLLGKEVITLVNKDQPAGEYQVLWDGTDNQGMEVSSGIYVALLKSSNSKKSIKLTIIR